MANVDKPYPYPVLGNREDIQAYFEYSADVTLNDEYLDISIDNNLRYSTIESLINEGQAAYCLDIKCGKTKFRSTNTFKESTYSMRINSKMLRDRVELSLYIIAIEDIEAYAPLAVNSNLDMGPLDIQKGDILADGGLRHFNADKYFDPLSQGAGSFIKVRKSHETSGPIKMNLDEEDVAISIPIEQFDSYMLVAKSSSLGSSFVHASYVMPVLIEAIRQCQTDEYKDYRWASRLATILDANGIDADEPYTAAQRILALPYERSTRYLVNKLYEDADYD